jgi:hypothetical protein
MKNLRQYIIGASLLFIPAFFVQCALNDDPVEEEDPDDPTEVDEECRSVCFPEQWKMIDGECYCAVELG